MNTNQKGFANIVLVVVIVILLGVVGYFAFVKKSGQVAQQPTPTPVVTQTKTPTPTPVSTPKDETINWQVYNRNGVLFKYPNDWAIKTDSSSASAGLNVFLQEKKYVNDEVNPFGLSIADAKGTDLSGAKNKRIFDVKDAHNTNFLENVIGIYFTENSKTFLATCTADVGICNKIITTFKFTK